MKSLPKESSLFLQNFTVLDFAFLCPEKGLLGESFDLSAEVCGRLDDQGFVMDFGRIKKLLKSEVDSLLDHRLAIPEKSPSLKEYWETDLSFNLVFASAAGLLEYAGPGQAVQCLNTDTITPSIVEKFLAEKILPQLGESVSSLRFFAKTSPRFSAEANYRYTHGLRLHEGNCQRLAHGHRNPIEVWFDGKRQEEQEKFLADQFEDVHFCFAGNLSNRESLDFPLEHRLKQHPGLAEIRYQAPQGDFFLKLPASKLILLAAEPSVEHLAALAQRMLAREFGKVFEVVAYEGLNKGAIARADKA